MTVDIADLERLLQYRFSNRDLLEEALTHPSLDEVRKTRALKQRQGKTLNYERLEFLGDAVCGMIIAEFLINEYPGESEGALARRRAVLVSGETLAQVASTIGLGHFLIMGAGENGTGGRQNRSNLENAMEAVIGALYLDAGIEITRQIIRRYWAPIAHNMQSPPRDPKTALQEWAQGGGKPIPHYRVVSSTGPSHAPSFTVAVQVKGLDPVEASGSSKRAAERDAARLMLEKLGISE